MYICFNRWIFHVLFATVTISTHIGGIICLYNCIRRNTFVGGWVLKLHNLFIRNDLRLTARCHS